MKPKQFEILVPTAVNQAFDYLTSDEIDVSSGDIVNVTFRKKEYLALVWAEGKAKIDKNKIKHIDKKYSELPKISYNVRKFIDWAAWYNCAPKGSILKMMLPINDIDKKSRIKLNTNFDINKIALSELSKIQKKAADHLLAKINDGFSVTLLDGVTGSGKTEVYFDTIAKALVTHKSETDKPQLLILLPEIGLSLQWIKRFESRFGFTPIIWNSEITPAKKRASWLAIAKGEAKVIIGARSALFLPYKNLGLIIIDEEHDGSYKQEDNIIYNARDMAIARAKFENIPVVLVSATPSLESYHNSRTGKYHEISLPIRHAEAVMPDVHIIDMRGQKLERGQFISNHLREKLANTIASGKQAMLFLNRRGYAPLTLCRACGYRFQCPDCSAWLVIHKGSGFITGPSPNPSLHCHHCGYNIQYPKTCPECSGEDTLHACGPGVERILEEVADFLPQARTEIMASDNSGENKHISKIIEDMSEKNIDILIGTQMIAKGYHFPNLTTIGVIDADLGLAGGDLRASERTYQLLHQLSGRAGREQDRGEVFLQSFIPDHPVIKALVSGNRDRFMELELESRKNADMPPFSRLAAIITEDESEEKAAETANMLAKILHAMNNAKINEKQIIRIYGPTPAPLLLLRGRFRYRLLIKSAKNINLSDIMANCVKSANTPSSTKVKLDIDPQSFL
ncbi:MAG: primosomal protein N' [Rickettsiales bacterium]